MGRLGQIAGLLLLIGGCGLAAWGAPYYMLDWGSVLVIAGCVLASAGLICLLLGTALVRLDALRGDMAFMRASFAVERLAAREPPPLQTEPERHHASFAQTPADAVPPSGMQGQAGVVPTGVAPTGAAIAGGLAAGGLAAGGLAVAAKSILGSVSDERAEPEQPAGQIEADPNERLAISPEEPVSGWDETYRPMDEADRTDLNDLLERVSDGIPRTQPENAAHESLGDADSLPDEDGEVGFPVDAEPEMPPHTGDDLFARIDEATRSLKDQSAWPRPAAEEAAIMDAAPDPAKQTPGQEDVFDDGVFDDLRADLNAEMGALPPDASVVEDANLMEPYPLPPDDMAVVGDDGLQSEAVLATLNDAEPHSQPPDGPVDQDHRHDTVSDLPDETGTNGAEAEEAAHPADQIDRHDDDAADAPEASSARDAATSQPPTPSDEGIVAAYTVGDSAFAMLSDGRIRVTTPDEQHLFNSMDELKVFMAERRSKILPV